MRIARMLMLSAAVVLATMAMPPTPAAAQAPEIAFEQLMVAHVSAPATPAPRVELVAQDTVVAEQPSAGKEFFSLAAGILAALGIAGATLAKKIAGKIDGTTEKVDGWLVRLWKPIQPIMGFVIGAGLGFLGHKFPGLPLPTTEQLMAAPASYPLLLAIREIAVRALAWLDLKS